MPIGGYDPSVKKILARAERRGKQTLERRDDDTGDSDDGNGDSDWERQYTPSPRHSTQVRRNLAEEEGWRSQRELEERCQRVSVGAIGGRSMSDPEPSLTVPERAEERYDRGRSSNTDPSRYYLRGRPEKMLPVFIRGNRLEYKPWQNTDMSEIIEKLPIRQDGAHPWTSKVDEILVGTQPAMGDIKKLLASLLGVLVMDEIFGKSRTSALHWNYCE
ncbi:hypothetical protein GBF38_012640 [Nibea albiflora]|uniref:Uncharacterized protein n=1 Tax=Nibea albiflora TaxID=240163 RepID=A0ACB7F055_NIBAL|nr:hypothetical protein GBF38_012640 [Nibea albiflora]